MFHVNGGLGDTSYANNSIFQRKVMSMTWPITKEAIRNLCDKNFPKTLITIAELGCSSGPNSLITVSNVVKQVEEIRKKLHKKPLEYQILLNDLHGNDFNGVFRSLPSLMQNLKTQINGDGAGDDDDDDDFGPCFFNGVPGSFYRRLFPSQTVHFFHSSYSLHWISQVPEGIENNKGNIFMSITSPKNVIEAYYNQFQKDFSMFLKCRAEELVVGGQMVLTMIGRRSEDPCNKECAFFWDLFTEALNSMVAEGLVEEEKVDLFNIPSFMPSPKEVEFEVLKEGSLSINHLQVSGVEWDSSDAEFDSSNIIIHNAHGFAGCVRSVIESLLIPHFGEAIMDELFSRYITIIVDKTSEKKLELINLTISVVKTKNKMMVKI